MTANCPSAVGHLYRFVAGSRNLEGEDSQRLLDVPTAVNKVAIMREAALKSVIFTGVPRVSYSCSSDLMKTRG